MSSPSQSGPSPRPNPSQPRRLQTPEERFGPRIEPELELVAEVPEAPDPFVPLPPVSQPNKKKRLKARHERQRFDRGAHHIESGRPKRKAHQAASHVPVMHVAPQEGAIDATNVTPEEKKQNTAQSSIALSRIRARRKRAWKRAGLLLVALAVMGTGVAALTAPNMEIDQVQITGLHATAPVLVKPIAMRLLGQNAIRANKGAVVQSVERLATVASARVVLHPAIPPRVELQVTERKPILRVGDGTAWWVVDETGNPYRQANAHDAKLPALTWGSPIQTQKLLDAKQWGAAMQLAQAVEANLGQKGMTSLADIRSMQLDANGEATLVMAASGGAPDLTLKLGNDQWNEKLARARTARLYFARTNRKAVELNLISLDLPRWTPQGVTPGAAPAPREASAATGTPTPAT